MRTCASSSLRLVQEVGTGDSAVATARKLGIPSFEYTIIKNYHAVKLAITELSDIQSAFATVFDKFGRVDLVNNAEYSRHFEELSDSQIGTEKEVNFFGLINVTRMAVEAMRD
ncbi:MAG: hypothetical protein Q9161_009321 [Pseudevernia consocians]